MAALESPWEDLDLFPLSFAQERLWFLYLLAPGDAAYNITLALDLEGPLDVAAYRAAVSEIVGRHEALRTVFPAGLDAPAQSPLPWEEETPVPWIDLAGLPVERATAEARRLAEAEARRPFRLETGPPFRAHLIRTSIGTQADRWLALFALHHIMGDGWTVELLLRELAPLYAAFREGRPAPLPEPALQYADYAVWQRERLSGAALEAMIEFWRGELAGAPAELALPSDRPRPASQSFRGGRLQDETAAGPLLRLAAQQGATPFMVLLAAFQAFLHRVTGQDDVVVGSPVADRGRTETEGIFGLFVNTLALRGRIDPAEPFRELLARTQGKVVAALAHQELPFDRLVRELGVERGADRNPLFQASLAFQGTAPEPPDLPGITATVIEDLALDAVPFDLSLSVQRLGERFELALAYSTDLFDPSTARRLLGQLRRLLEGIGEDPGTAVRDLPLLSAAERHQLCVEWVDTRSDYPRDATLPELFARQAERTPEAVALVQGDAEMTYRELRDRARALAASLRWLGVGPDMPVAVALPRSFDSIVAILGVLEAGGAYVPVETSYPRERIARVLRDSGAGAVVARGEQGFDEFGIPVLETSKAYDLTPTPLLKGEGLEERSAGLPSPLGEGPGVRSQATDALPNAAQGLAYVMYTSGSTGTPKGVAVTHRNVARLVLGTDFAHFGPDEVFLQLAPVAFDASTLEIWGPLLHGGRLVLAPEGRVSLAELSALLRRHGVTTLWLTAGLFHQMVDEEVGGLAGVRQLLAGGDVLSPPHVRRALAALPGTAIIDGYGPTEGTTFTACHRMTSADDVGGSTGAIPIGRPIANTTAWVLDAEMRPVPIGVVGELYAGGDGVARGYVGRPDLTAERFVPDPSADGGRLYRTGDRARWLPDGRLDFLGRADRQLKVAGWRIEPGEVEAALAAHPAVREAVVDAWQDAGGKRLAAWVAAGPPAPSTTELRAWVRERLPEPMVPSLWAVLDRLPLTANGKVDRRALPAPGLAAAASAATPAIDAGAAAGVLAAIWASLLGREGAGAHDDFFALGGNSLLALRAVSRIRDAFGVEIPVDLLFAAPTPAALAPRLAEARGAAPLPPVTRSPRGGEIPLSSAQERLWVLDRLQAGSAYHVPLALRLSGGLDVAAWSAAWAELRRRHEALRTVFRESRGGPVQTIAPWSPEPTTVVDLSGLPTLRREAEALRLAAAEAARPFDLAAAPPVRAALLRLGAEDHLWVAVLHHIVTDAWSNRVMLAEMRELYAAAREGRPSSLAEPPVQAADYAVWERRRIAGGGLAPGLAWWRERLAGLPPLELPADRARPAEPSFAGRTAPAPLPAEAAADLATLARDRDATLFMGCLAAFAAFLHRVTGSADLAVGSPVANRDRPELEGLVGFFVNTLALRIDLAGDPPFAALLDRVRAAALAAYSWREVPFDRLVEELAPKRRPDENPLFQVAFSLDRPAVPDLSALGLAATAVQLPTGGAPFDLYLAMEETPGGLSGSWEARSARFDAATLARLSRQWRRLVEDAAAHPERPLSALALLSNAERHQVEVEWPERAGGAVLDGAGRPVPIGTAGTFQGERARWLADGRIEALEEPAGPAVPGLPESAAAPTPSTPAEELLAGLFAELLGLPRVNGHDDFFDLGGHSLLATRLIARVHRLFGVDLPLRALFEASTPAALAAKVAESAAGGPPPPIAPLPPGDVWPASLAQRRLWFLDRLAPERFFLNVPHGLRLRGRLDGAALRRALSAIAARHEPLRTTFEMRDGQPVQRIRPPEPVELPVTDLAALPRARREEEARRLARGQAELTFDLARGPLFRAALLRLGTADHLLAFTPHHLAFDGGSMGVLFRELAALYAGRELPPLPVRFVEVSEHQRGALSGERLEAQLAWWRRHLAGLPTLDLPTDRPRPPAPRFAGSWRTAVLPGLLPAVEALARRHGVTPYMVLLAAFEVLLGRLSGQDDFPLGSPVAGRSRPEAEGLIGFFANTLVLRADLSGEPSFAALLGRVREDALGAWAHQDLPFEVLVEELAPERHLSLNPLFQVVFSLQELPPGSDLPGLTADLYEFEADAAHFDLTLIAGRTGGAVDLTLSYKRDLFDPATVVRMLDQLGAILTAAAARPETAVRDLPLGGPAARHQALHEWSGAGSLPAPLTADRLFEAQARRTPDALAIAGPGGSLTYGELNARANGLARRLRRLGVGRGDRVALELDRSPELVTAALAIWKAGAAYLPLDPANPAERRAGVAEDAGARLVLDAERLAFEISAAADHEPETALPRDTGPDDLAYVIYTSGSTGEPKGVAVPHAGLAGLVAWHLAAYGVTPADRASLVASPAFDASVWEAWPYLAAGASLHVPPREVAASPGALLAWLAAERITLAFLPTPLAEAALARPMPDGLALRALLTGGDRLRRAPAIDPGFRLVNHYGPTESSVVATAAAVEPGDARPPAIGRAIDGVEVLLLDAGFRPVPPGALGEIHLGGRGLAAGYLGRPDLTAAAFVPHPFAAEPGARLYRTGDLARRRPDGALEFAGRADAQVKIRGFRIEPGEVEARLAAHPDVRAAVVVARDDGAGPRLVAYVESPAPDFAVLRDHLRARLPEPMVPSAWVALDALPLTSRGKVDRAALPPPPAAAPAVQEAPRGSTEEAVARLWREALGIAAAGRDDNFFDLGGHSLALAAVHERLQAELDVRLPLVDLFENPTVRSLAARVESRRAPAAMPEKGVSAEALARAEKQRAAAAWKERTRQARRT